MRGVGTAAQRVCGLVRVGSRAPGRRLSAGVPAVLMLAGAAGVVDDDDDGGAGVDCTSIQAAVNAAAAGDMIKVRGGTNARECGE